MEIVENDKIRSQPKLNFSKIIRTNITLDQFEFYQDKFDQLLTYEEDSFVKGFSDFDEDIVMDIVLVKNNKFRFVKNFGSKIIKKRFFFRKKDKESHADIFWIVPCNLFLIRGSIEISKKVMKELRFILKKNEIKEIEIENDFLMWIASKYSTKKGKLSKSMFIDQIDQGGTIKSAKGTSASRVNQIMLKKGRRTDLSLPAIYGLVNDHKFSLIGGDFTLRKTINLKLTTKNTILAYSNKKDLKNKNIEEKYGIIFPMINEIVNIIEYWNNLNDDQKYPDDNYMEAMSESFELQVAECRKNLQILREKYSAKRKKID